MATLTCSSSVHSGYDPAGRYLTTILQAAGAIPSLALGGAVTQVSHAVLLPLCCLRGTWQLQRPHDKPPSAVLPFVACGLPASAVAVPGTGSPGRRLGDAIAGVILPRPDSVAGWRWTPAGAGAGPGRFTGHSGKGAGNSADALDSLCPALLTAGSCRQLITPSPRDRGLYSFLQVSFKRFIVKGSCHSAGSEISLALHSHLGTVSL